MRKTVQPIGLNVKTNSMLMLIIGAAAILFTAIALTMKDETVLKAAFVLGIVSGVMCLLAGTSSILIIRKSNRADLKDFRPVTVLEARGPDFSVIEDDSHLIAAAIKARKQPEGEEMDEEYEPV